jgi:hypothetical protein
MAGLHGFSLWHRATAFGPIFWPSNYIARARRVWVTGALDRELGLEGICSGGICRRE